MELKTYFEGGLTIEAYTQLLDADQRNLHDLYTRRAEIDEAAVAAVRSAGPCKVLVITEPWCGDSLAIFPVVARLFSEAGCDVRVVRRDEHLELIDQYLTHGGRSIPIVIAMDSDFDERFRWGPRPKPAQDLVLGYKEDVAAGRMEKMDVHKMVRAFYARNHGRAIVEELTARLRET
jgi:thiol-disulfide isomerase/thioredoxin